MSEAILTLENITKIYPNGTLANKNINIEFEKGEIHSVVGENGAGKSTLMKIIFAIEKQTEGKIIYKGREVSFASSMDAIENGIGMVHQHFMLIPSFTVAQNITLGAEPKKGLFIDKKAVVQKTGELAKQYHFDIDVTSKVADLSVSAKQKVEILKTLYRDAEVIILDEPTAVLTPQETEQLFEQLKIFKEMGHTIVFISHKLNEVKSISDRITVIRDGETKGTFLNKDITMDQLTELIVGRKIETSYESYKKKVKDPQVIFKLEDFSCKAHGIEKVKNLNITIRSGEILGIAGVQGNGQEELIKILTGLEHFQQGRILLNGEAIEHNTIHQRRQAGMSYIPEDRMADGVAQAASVSDNLISTVYNTPELSGKVFLKNKAIVKETGNLIENFSIKVSSQKEKLSSLSGGNIQKVVVAREWNTKPKLMVAEQPTRGIDIGSAEYIHHQLIEMRNQGAGILLVSADLTEVMALSDRLVVMYDGEIVAYFDSLKGVSENQLGYYMLGIEHQSEEEIRRAAQ
ncbi:MAG: ABC transporter ATP-binding protein [Erysipelotrichaceae bacterium]|jgi:simple sugar transport system ATP-binding protein|nr:ABC transporter ATP-binding protein [Erysipelotrichaceae bacterium]